MNVNEPGIYYQRPDARLVKLPDNSLDDALDRLSEELKNGHYGGQLCTRRAPTQKPLTVAPTGELSKDTFYSAKGWLGAYLAATNG